MEIGNGALYWTEAGIDLCGEPGGSVVREGVVDSEPETIAERCAPQLDPYA
jgi:hypothetical protein